MDNPHYNHDLPSETYNWTQIRGFKFFRKPTQVECGTPVLAEANTRIAGNKANHADIYRIIFDKDYVLAYLQWHLMHLWDTSKLGKAFSPLFEAFFAAKKDTVELTRFTSDDAGQVWVLAEDVGLSNELIEANLDRFCRLDNLTGCSYDY